MAAVVILVTLLLPDIVVPFANTMPVATRSRKQKQKQKQAAAAAAAAVAASSAVVPTVAPAVVSAVNSQLLEVVSSNAATIGNRNNLSNKIAEAQFAANFMIQVCGEIGEVKSDLNIHKAETQASICNLQQQIDDIKKGMGS